MDKYPYRFGGKRQRAGIKKLKFMTLKSWRQVTPRGMEGHPLREPGKVALVFRPRKVPTFRHPAKGDREVAPKNWTTTDERGRAQGGTGAILQDG
jgi:hypothetical protein